MELILTLIGEFVIAPMLSFVVQVFQFLFWMCYWVIYTIVCCLSAAKRSIRSMVTSQMSSTIPGKHPTADKP